MQGLMNLILTFIYMGIVFILSVIKVHVGVAHVIGVDKVIHFCIYGLMGALWVRVFLSKRGRGFGYRERRIIFKAVVISFLYGLLIEFVQGFLPAREASFFDALANGAGAFAGASLYCFVNKSFRLS